MLTVRADERHEQRRVLLIARDDPRFFAWDFSVLPARRTRHDANAIDHAALDAGLVHGLILVRRDDVGRGDMGQTLSARPRLSPVFSAPISIVLGRGTIMCFWDSVERAELSTLEPMQLRKPRTAERTGPIRSSDGVISRLNVRLRD